jgi:signal transduction histidine kinase
MSQTNERDASTYASNTQSPTAPYIVQSLLDASPTMSWVVDREYRLITANVAFISAMTATTGSAPVIGESVLLPAFPEEVLEHWKAQYDDAFAGQTRNQVRDMPTPTGSISLELTTAPLRSDSGNIVGCTAICREIGASDEDVRDMLRRMTERAAVLRDVADAMPVGLLLLDHRGRVRWANRVASDIVGVADFSSDLAFVHRTDVDAVRARRWGYLRGDHTLGEPSTVRYVHPDGQTIWTTVRLAPLPLRHPEAEQLHVMTVADRTSDMQAQRLDAVHHTRQQRQQRLESLGTLAAGLSHEFRNLLAVVGGNVELLEGTAPRGGVEREALRELALVAVRGRELLHSILLFTRGERDGTPAWTDVMPHIRSATQMAQSSLRGVRFDNDLADHPVQSLLSATEWMQIVVNVLQNAAQAIEGRPEGRVTVSASRITFEDSYECSTGRLEAGHYLRLGIRDNGVGVPAEHLPHLFDPFFSTRAEAGGTGIGLSMVAGILRQAGGAAELTSTEGVGTSVALYAPTRVSPSGPRTAARLKNRALIVSMLLERKRSIERSLQEAGFTTVGTCQPVIAEALVRGDAFGYDIAYLDFDLGTQTGADVASTMSTLSPRLPIIVGAVGSALLNDTALAERGVAAVLRDVEDPADIARAMQAALLQARADDR